MSVPEVKPWDRFCDFVFESTRIFKAFSMALDAKKLVFAFCGVVLWGVGTMLINVLAGVQWTILLAGGLVAVVFIFIAFARSQADFSNPKTIAGLLGSVFAVAILVTVLILLTERGAGERFFLINIYKIAWTLAVASFLGTAVARIAAMDAATGDAIGPRETARFALKKLSTSIWTLLLPVVAVVGFGICLLLVGLPGRIPGFGPVWYAIIGVLYIIALLGGLFFAVTLIVYVPGLVLFQPAIGAEGNDSFDAISRAYSYVFGKPWRLAFYGIASFVYARIVLSVAAVLFALAGRITNVFLAKGIGETMSGKIPDLDLGATFGIPFANESAGALAGSSVGYVASNAVVVSSGPVARAGGIIMEGKVLESFQSGGSVGGWFIVFWQYILLAIFMAFALSFIYSIFTQIYFLMRKACDGTPFEEVFIEEPEEEAYAAEFEGEEAAEEKPAEKEKPAVATRPKKKVKKKEEKRQEPDKPIDLAGADEATEGEDVGE